MQVSHFLLILLTRPFIETNHILNNEEKIILLKLLLLIIEYHNNFYIHRNVYEKVMRKYVNFLYYIYLNILKKYLIENREPNEYNVGEIFNEHSDCYRRLILKERILEKYKNVNNRMHLSNNVTT